VLVLLVLAFVSGALAADRHAPDFSDATAWAKRFDDPARDAWQKPDEVVRALALAPDAIVADGGAGTGYFSVRLARAVPQGRVYAIDAEPAMVRYVEARAKRERLANVVPVAVAADNPRISEPVDLILVVNTYHHIPNRLRYFSALKDRLKPGGRVAIVDYTQAAPMGPPIRVRIPASGVKVELDRAGYRLVAEHAFLPHQHFLVFGSRTDRSSKAR